ncbi:MAG: CoA-binding protein [Thermodesulfobacteriota bacterium]|nr:CoA-binding protein [Thermodesulfobacteriota bacterium]
MAANIVEQLDPIFKPKSIAFIGASNHPGKWGYRVVERALKSGYRGMIYPINPGVDEILGIKTYPSVNEVPNTIDLAIFTVPAAKMPMVMDGCIKKGIKGGVVISAGFAETGNEGATLENEIVKVAQSGGLRFVGPNGMGIWTSAVGLNVALDPAPSAGPIAFISQSGTFGGSLAQIATTKGYGLSKFVSVGNQADIKADEYLEYFVHDQDTKVIVLYIEGFKDGRKFFEVAREVVKIKPILIYKGGRSSVGARATMSHTASMAGSDEIFDAMCRQVGIMRTNEVEHLFDMAEALVSQPLPKGNRIAILGSGGQGVVTTDSCAALGLAIPELDEKAKLKLKEVLPPHAPTPSNPVDFAGGSRTAMEEASIAEKLADIDYIDGIITNIPGNAFQSGAIGDSTKTAIDGAEKLASIPQRYEKPIITLKFRTREDDIVTDILKDSGIPAYETPEDCAMAMYALVRYAEIRREKK